ncbi:MAG TPA: VOC family protein [Longimicrobium sp.]|jgi:uncharacterized glyoxalase superfamily protein PhnB
MTPSYKPEGYNSASPYLIVAGADRAMDFLARAFDAVEMRRFTSPAGTVGHAEMRIDDSIIMIADAVDGWPPVPSHVHLYVADVDAAYQRALECGGESVKPPSQASDEDRRGGVRDPGGTTWWISTRVGMPAT